jgi:hypothetical protein
MFKVFIELRLVVKNMGIIGLRFRFRVEAFIFLAPMNVLGLRRDWRIVAQ